MENIIERLNTFFAMFTERANKFWHDVNTASHIRSCNRRANMSVRKRLEYSLVLMFITFSILVSSCLGSYFAESNKEKTFLIVIGVTFFGVLAWLSGYRDAIAESKAARLSYINNTYRSFRRVIRNTSRCINRLLRVLFAVLIISILLVYLPNMEDIIPSAVEAAHAIVEFFNDCIAKAITYINSYLA